MILGTVIQREANEQYHPGLFLNVENMDNMLPNSEKPERKGNATFHNPLIPKKGNVLVFYTNYSHVDSPCISFVVRWLGTRRELRNKVPPLDELTMLQRKTCKQGTSVRIKLSKGIHEILFQKDLGASGERVREEGNEGRSTIISAFLAHYQSGTKNNRSSNEVLRMEKRDPLKEGDSLGLDKGLDVTGQEQKGRSGLWLGISVGITGHLSQSSFKSIGEGENQITAGKRETRVLGQRSDCGWGRVTSVAIKYFMSQGHLKSYQEKLSETGLLWKREGWDQITEYSLS